MAIGQGGPKCSTRMCRFLALIFCRIVTMAEQGQAPLVWGSYCQKAVFRSGDPLLAFLIGFFCSGPEILLDPTAVVQGRRRAGAVQGWAVRTNPFTCSALARPLNP